MDDRGIGGSIVSRGAGYYRLQSVRIGSDFTQAATQRVMISDLPVVKRALL